MYDPRVERLARVLVQYSTGVRQGDLVYIAAPVVARPLAVAVYREVLAAGGNPLIELVPEECQEILLTEGSEQQLRFEDPVSMFVVENVDVLIKIRGADNTKALSEVDPKRQALVSQAAKRRISRFLERAAQGQLRWTTTQFPCHAAAQDAEMSLASYERFVYGAGMLDREDPVACWRDLSCRQQRLVDYLMSVKELRFVTPQGTDLRVGVEGRKWLNCDGKENFPDGEVFTGPVEDATEGTFCASFPAVHGGREVRGVRLKFEAGRVVEASAEHGEDFLLAMLDQDEGARILGEIAIGTNYRITRFTKNTLFDEKIGGTFHLALGAAYPESGGRNKSALHWDMVCDLRQGGKIYADGELIFSDGRFLREDWPQPDAAGRLE